MLCSCISRRPLPSYQQLSGFLLPNSAVQGIGGRFWSRRIDRVFDTPHSSNGSGLDRERLFREKNTRRVQKTGSLRVSQFWRDTEPLASCLVQRSGCAAGVLVAVCVTRLFRVERITSNVRARAMRFSRTAFFIAREKPIPCADEAVEPPGALLASRTLSLLRLPSFFFVLSLGEPMSSSQTLPPGQQLNTACPERHSYGRERLYAIKAIVSCTRIPHAPCRVKHAKHRHYFALPDRRAPAQTQNFTTKRLRARLKKHKLRHAINSFNAPSEDQRPTQTALSRAPSRNNNGIAVFVQQTDIHACGRTIVRNPSKQKTPSQASELRTYIRLLHEAGWSQPPPSGAGAPTATATRPERRPRGPQHPTHHTPATLRDSREKQTEVSLRRGAGRRHHGE